MDRILCVLLVSVLIVGLWSIGAVSEPNDMPRLTRDQIISYAKTMAEYKWTCREDNRHVDKRCENQKPYECDWQAGDNVTGIAYDWGGCDNVEQFAGKLAEGKAAGSHSADGVTDCTAGTDCSGLVSLCWGQTKTKYGTTTIRTIAAKPKYNWFTEMKPGDALVKPGSHIVLFASYDTSGNPVVYEASGPKHRVVYRMVSWDYLNGYFALEYKGVAHE
jgi:hypothetical protein